MKLILSFIYLFHCLQFANGATKEQTLLGEINRNWSHSPLYIRQNANSKIKTKLFQRVLWAGKTPIHVAQTNFTFLSNPEGKVDLKKISETMVNSFPLGTLTARPISNGYRLEGEWKAINRMVKIDILVKNKDFLTVTTLYRPSISKVFNKELEAFHSLLKSYEESSIIKTSYINFLINDANAAPTIPSIGSLTTLLTTPNPTTGTSPLSNAQAALNTSSGISPVTDTGLTNLGGGMSDLGTGMTNLGTAITPLSTSLDHTATATGDLAQAIKDSNKVITEQGNQANQTALKISAETNATINRQGDQANQTALKISAETNATINRQGDAFNKNYAESNRIAALALDPNHMAKLAYYTAAGAALGSLTVSLAVDGIAAGFSFLKEFFTGAKEKALDWEKFQKATATWDSQVEGLVNYEKVVDELIKSFDFFQNEHLDNDYLSNLQKTKLEMKFDEKEELALAEDKSLSKECRFKHYEIADFLHNKIDDYEKTLKFAKDQHLKIDDNQKYFCQQLSELKQRILQAEQQMADIRFAILKAERQFYDKATERIEQRQDDVEKVNSELARTIKAQQSFDKETTGLLNDFEEKNHDEWINACISRKNNEGKKIEEERLAAMKKGDLKYLVSFNFKRSCDGIYKKVHKEIKRDTEVQQDLTSGSHLRKDLSIEGNINVDIALSEEQQKWFTRIHMDAHCYPFAHRADDLIPKECKEFPEMLSSLRLSKGADKAQEAYKKNCQSAYASGLKKLASH